MPIHKIQYGTHENVLYLEFGYGDIMFTRGAIQGEENDSVLIFSQDEPHEIGAETDEHKGKLSDDLPPVSIIITMGKEVLEANGGGAEWQKHFESCVRSEDSGFWLHKSRNAPKAKSTHERTAKRIRRCPDLAENLTVLSRIGHVAGCNLLD